MGNKDAAIHRVLPSTLKNRLRQYMIHSWKPDCNLCLTKQEENELTDHLMLAAKVGYGKTQWDFMNLVETYMNSQPYYVHLWLTTSPLKLKFKILWPSAMDSGLN